MDGGEVVDVRDGDGVAAEVVDVGGKEMFDFGDDLVRGRHLAGALSSYKVSGLFPDWKNVIQLNYRKYKKTL